LFARETECLLFKKKEVKDSSEFVRWWLKSETTVVEVVVPNATRAVQAKKRNAAPRRHLVEVQVSRQKRQRKGKLLRMEGSAFSTNKKKRQKNQETKKNRVWVMMIFLLKRDRC